MSRYIMLGLCFDTADWRLPGSCRLSMASAPQGVPWRPRAARACSTASGLAGSAPPRTSSASAAPARADRYLLHSSVRGPRLFAWNN